MSRGMTSGLACRTSLVLPIRHTGDDQDSVQITHTAADEGLELDSIHGDSAAGFATFQHRSRQSFTVITPFRSMRLLLLCAFMLLPVPALSQSAVSGNYELDRDAVEQRIIATTDSLLSGLAELDSLNSEEVRQSRQELEAIKAGAKENLRSTSFTASLTEDRAFEMEASPPGGQTIRMEGTWRMEEQILILTFTEIAGNKLPEPDVVETQYKDGEILISGLLSFDVILEKVS